MPSAHEVPVVLTLSDGYTVRLRTDTVASLCKSRRLPDGGWSPAVASLAANDELIGQGLAERRTVPVLTRRGEEVRAVIERLVPLGINGEVPGRCTIDPALGEEETARLSAALRTVAEGRFDDGRARSTQLGSCLSSVTPILLASGVMAVLESWWGFFLGMATALASGLLIFVTTLHLRRRAIARTPPNPIQAHGGHYVAPAMLDGWGSALLLRAQRAVDAAPGPVPAQEEWAIARDLADLAPADRDTVPDAEARSRVERSVLALEEYAAGERGTDPVGT
jgi:hypothetical protein